MLDLTEACVARFKEIVEEQGEAGDGVRLFMQTGGCCPSLAMGIVKEAAPGDTALEMDGLIMFLEPEAKAMLEQATIDFAEAQGFVISGMESDCSSSSCNC